MRNTWHTITCLPSKSQPYCIEGSRMKLQTVFEDKVFGVLNGLDRIRFRGTLRRISDTTGINMLMWATGMLLKDFGRFAESQTQALRDACSTRASTLGIPCIYLRSSRIDKEEMARKIAAERGVVDGPICQFSVVEPCMAPHVRGNRETGKLELVMAERKCVFLYHYFDHPEVGFGHVRLQTWLPYSIHVCLNGRHWLEKQMHARGMRFRKSGNCFRWVEDVSLAQDLMNTQLATDWNKMLGSLLKDMVPDIHGVLAPVMPDYYWSAEETEYASDMMFRSAADLDALFPSLVRHAMMVSNSPAVMRFLGRSSERGVAPDEVISDCRRRYEGVRVKHWVNQNSVKMYNKANSVLRIETTINNTRVFKVFRPPEDRPGAKPSWQKMRKGVSDLHRRCEISASSNERYADAIAACRSGGKLLDVAAPVCKPAVKDGRSARAINPLKTEDMRLLQFIADGRLAVNGFRNKDLKSFLFGNDDAREEKANKRRSAMTTRQIFLLRAHGLVRKIPKENRYVVTANGQKLAASIIAASVVDIEKLMEMAA